jgi:ankyrin repeat protein
MPRAGLRSEDKVLKVMAEARIKIKALQSVETVELSEELAELLRWRMLTWSRIPPLVRKMMLPFLTLPETLTLDTAVLERGEEDERDHLIKAYVGLRSPGFDEWVFKGTKEEGFVGVKWARKRDINLQNLKLEYEGERGNKALGKLVVDENKEMATFYAARSEVRDAKVVNRYGIDSTTLIEAIQRGYLEVAKCLIDRGADVNKANNSGGTPLSAASCNGHLEVVRALLGAKAEVNKADIGGWTPLYWASIQGHLEIVRALLDAKAEVNKADNRGMTPLSAASMKGHLEVVRALLDAKAEVNKADTDGKTPLHIASSKGHLEVVRALLGAKAEVNKANDDGRTPLYEASRNWHVEVVRALLGAKAEVNKANDDGRTPLSVALFNNHPEIAALLREAGAHEPQPN